MKYSFLFFILLLGHIASGQSKKLIRIPGTNCSMVPPEGFVLVTAKSGFIDSSKGASIVVGEIPEPYDSITTEFSKENFRKRNGELISKEVVTGRGPHSVLLIAQQTEFNSKYRTMILVFGDDKKTVVVAGNYPEASASLEPVIKAAVLSTVYHQLMKGNAKGR